MALEIDGIDDDDKNNTKNDATAEAHFPPGSISIGSSGVFANLKQL